MIFLVTILYALQKMDVIISKKDVDILSTVKEGFFDDDYVFSHENGLGIAVAFTGYNNEREWSLDPSYGNLVFNSFSWGVSDDGSYFTEWKKLDHHVCTPTELGLEGREGAKFLPMHESTAPLIELY